eukprot:Mrub_03545.p1 GENE.Mrub_03545~~Mrub_03545.p1  ORF type:complete len:475 (+),score=82.43 Mrub_03545:147-1427(+)
MQTGFAMLEMGTVRAKNSKNILIKNMLDIFFAAFIWYFIGYGIAYGDGTGEYSIIGTNKFAGYSSEPDFYKKWLFSWAFAGTASTIVSGSLAERCYLSGYIIMSCLLTSFIYPVIAHWTWSENGWLRVWGYRDFAGAGPVHLVGGVCGFVGAYILGPRLGRFKDDNRLVPSGDANPEGKVDYDESEFRPHNAGLVTLGTFILWFGFYGFNAGSGLGGTGALNTTVSLVSMNTTISAAASGLASFITCILYEHQESITSLTNGLIIGLVGITASCNVANYWLSFIIGVTCGVLNTLIGNLVRYYKIDDPLDASTIHAVGGMVGLIYSSLFRVFWLGEPIQILYGTMMGMGVIIVFTGLMSILIFNILNYYKIMRVPFELELQGLDQAFHGGYAYNFGNYEYEEDEIDNNLHNNSKIDSKLDVSNKGE